MQAESSGRFTTVNTTVVVSGVIRSGWPAAVLELWRTGRFELVITFDIYAEIADVLNRPRIRDRYTVAPERIATLLAALRAQARWITPQPIDTLPLHCRDPRDDKFLACAIAGGCEYLVTGDTDLLVLEGDPALGALRILTPRAFGETMQAAGGG